MTWTTGEEGERKYMISSNAVMPSLWKGPGKLLIGHMHLALKKKKGRNKKGRENERDYSSPYHSSHTNLNTHGSGVILHFSPFCLFPGRTCFRWLFSVRRVQTEFKQVIDLSREMGERRGGGIFQTMSCSEDPPPKKKPKLIMELTTARTLLQQTGERCGISQTKN